MTDDDVSNWQKRLDRLADERQREQTAATLLAALTQAPFSATHANEPWPEQEAVMIEMAVRLTDALRAALKAKEGK